MGKWTQVGENLVKHQSGTIYLRAKVKGKVIRVSLEVTDLRIAKLKRDDRLASLRTAAEKAEGRAPVRTFGDAIALVQAKLLEQPDLKPETLRYYREMITILNQTLPTAALGRNWTALEAAVWWKSITSKYAAQRANNVLGMCRRVTGELIAAGQRTDDPTKKLRRQKIEPKEIWVPSKAQMDQIIESIRSQNKAWSKRSASFVGFLAFAGPRLGQAQAFLREHIESELVDTGNGPEMRATWLKFPSGISGTKGAATRRLPINSPLRAILEGMDLPETGQIFGMKTPKECLKNACKRLGFPHMRLHDLRHFFAVYAIEAGVDIPTVASWLGHKDGGVLLLKTYNHLRDSHSLASAAKLGA